MYRQPSHAGLASLVAAQGRNGDSMLVHMTPAEVNTLREVAEANGIPFTVNPHTGIPEASLLGDVFSAIWGGIKTVGSTIASNPNLTAAAVATTYGAMKGDLRKGLEAGIKAYAGSSLLRGLTQETSPAQEAVRKTTGPRIPTAVEGDMFKTASSDAGIDVIKPTVQPNILNQIGAGLRGVFTPQQGGIPQQPTQVAQGQRVSPVTQLLLNYGLNRLEQKYGGAREGTAPSQPVQYRDVRYSRGRVNPRFREPGQPYWIEGGYEDRGYTTEYPGYTQQPTVQQPTAPYTPPYQPPNQPYGMAMGGMVPDEGVIPAPNNSYPMANIKSAGYSVASQRPRSAELLGGYDTAVDPFTGEEIKSQSNFADGGTVEEDKLKDYFKNLRPNAPALASAFGSSLANSGIGSLQGNVSDSLKPVSPELADYYKSLLTPPGPRPSRIDLTDYFKISGYKPGTGSTSGMVCPAGQHFDTKTMECVDDTVTPPVEPPVKSCPSGTYKDPSGNCIPIQPPSTECPAGKAFNPVTGKCDDTAKGCDPGTHLEIVDGIMNCVPDEPEPPKPPPPPGDECKPGYVRDENGNCVRKTKADTTCPDGSQQYDEEGRLICPEAPPPPPPPPSPVCGKGYHLNFRTLECERDVDTSVTCPDGSQNYDEDGKLICPEAPPTPPPPPPPTTECKPGYVRDNDGNCVRKTAADTTCPDGSQQYDEEGRLICPEAPPERPPTCPEGTMFDPVRVECVSITPPTPSEECKPGYERTESGKCKKIYTNVEDDPVWVEVIRRLGGVLYPWQTDVADALYKELKKADIITTEKRCRGGADKIFDADSKTLLCPEDMPTGNESEKQDPRDLYRGSGGYDYGCPDPGMMIRLAGGGEVAAGDIKVGDMVHTMHEKTLEWGDYEVTYKEIVDQPKLEIIFDGGKKKVIVSESHRFWTNNNDWVNAIDLDKGDVVSGHSVSDISILGEGPVVKITVNDAHTYIMENLFSHNIKSLGPSGSKGSGYYEELDEFGNPISSIKISNAAGGRIKSRRKYATGGIAGLNSGAVNAMEGYNFGFAQGGMAAMPEYKAGGKLLRGPGDGMSDDIPAVIRGKTVQRAALADGEFVIPADVVSHLGNGSTDAGAKKLYKMMEQIRRARTGRGKQAPRVNTDKFLPRV